MLERLAMLLLAASLVSQSMAYMLANGVDRSSLVAWIFATMALICVAVSMRIKRDIRRLRKDINKRPWRNR